MKTAANKSRRGEGAKFAFWLGLVLVMPLPAAAQGTINFNNKVSGAVDAPVSDVDGTPLSGTNFLAQLCAETGSGIFPISSAVPFRTGADAGYFSGGTVTFRLTAPGGTALLQVRAWDAKGGTNFLQALSKGVNVGQSEVFSVVTGGFGFPPSPPATLQGLKSFKLTITAVEVSNSSDGGPASLRQAIQDVAPGGTITFATNLAGTIVLTNELAIDKSLTIVGPGPARLTISGNGSHRVFSVSLATYVTLAGMTISDGSGIEGGAVAISSASLVTISNFVVTSNHASDSGGGISNAGQLTVINSTISSNTVSSDPMPSGGGGGISNLGLLTLINSTLSGNRSDGSLGGGGIINTGTADINSTTVVNNSAANDGGGVRSRTSSLTIFRNTIVAGNAADGLGPDVEGSFKSGGHNLVGVGESSAGLTDGVNGDLVGASMNPRDPNLGPLKDNGGPTFTHALLPGSPAIDAGESTGLPLRFVVPDPVGDSTGNADVTGMVFDFDDETGDYKIELTASAERPFKGRFRVNINLFNPDTGTTACDPAFFNHTLADYDLPIPTNSLILQGTNNQLTRWHNGDRVALTSAAFGNPDCAALFSSAVSDLPSNSPFPEDQIGTTEFYAIIYGTDQRGRARAFNGILDIGAFELQPGDKLWGFDAGLGLSISPTIGADGTIYFGTGAEQGVPGKLYSLKPDGTTKWILDLGATNLLYMDPLSTAPAIGPDGTIYIGSELGRLFAFEDKFTNGCVKWSFQTPSSKAIYASPAIGTDGTIYFASTDPNLYAIKDNQTNATLKWVAPMAGENGSSLPVRSSPAVGPDGTIYVGSRANILYAFEDKGTSFDKKWEFPTGAEIVSSPAIGSDGSIYVGSFDSKLYAITTNGVSKWVFESNGAIASSPAVGTNGTVYIGSHDHHLYAVRDGATIWSVLTGGEVRSSPAIGEDGNIYVASSDNKLYSISSAGTTNWMFDAKYPFDFISPAIGLDGTIFIGNANGTNGTLYATRGTTRRLADDAPWPKFHRNLRQTANAGVAAGDMLSQFETDSGVYAAPALGTNGNVFSLSIEGRLSAFSTQRLELWKTDLALEAKAAPAIGPDGTIYVAGKTYNQQNNGKLLAINPDGSQKWLFETMVGFETSSPVVATDGTVYIGNPDGKLYAVKPDKSLKWSLAIGPPIASAPAIGTDGTIYVASGNMLLAIRDEGTQGSPLWPNSAITTGEVHESSPAIGPDGTIYIGTYYNGHNDARLNAFNPDGSRKWVNPEAYDYTIRSSAVIGTGDTIFVGVDADTYKLVALDARTGSKKGEFDTHKIYSYATPAIASDGTIYFASSVDYGSYFAHGGGVLYALRFDGTNFSKLWEFGTEGGIDSSPAIAPDGTVYFGSADKRLYALKGSSGLASTAWPMFAHDLQHTGRASFEVQPPTLSVLGFPNGLFTLRVTAASGELVIQGTTNLTNWQDIHTNTTANGSFDFSDPGTAQFPKRFYRVLGR